MSTPTELPKSISSDSNTSISALLYAYSEDECKCKICDFIKRIVLPCVFCEECGDYTIEYITLQHIESTSSNILFRLSIISKTAYVIQSDFFIKIANKDDVPFLDIFTNEVIWYSLMRHFHKSTFSPLFYIGSWKHEFAFTVMKDLSRYGYKQMYDVLNEEHLAMCMKSLATLHAITLRELNNENTENDEEKKTLIKFWNYLQKGHTLIENKARRQEVISSFLKKVDGFIQLKHDLRKKIKQALRYMQQDHFENYLDSLKIVVHGNLARSNIFVYYLNDTPFDIKILDWQTVRVDTPAIDIGRMLFTNLPEEDDILELGNYFWKMINVYLEHVRKLIPKLADMIFEEKYIIDMLFLSYLHVYATGSISNPVNIKLLCVLNNLGSLNISL